MKRNAYLQWNIKYLILCCGLEIIYGCVSMYFAVVLNTVAVAASKAENIGGLLYASVQVLLFGILYPASRALADSVTQAYSEGAAGAVRSRINRAIFSMDSSVFSQQDIGEYLNSLKKECLLHVKSQRASVRVLCSEELRCGGQYSAGI